MNELKIVTEPCLVPVDTEIIFIKDDLVETFKSCAKTAIRIEVTDSDIKFVYEEQTDE